MTDEPREDLVDPDPSPPPEAETPAPPRRGLRARAWALLTRFTPRPTSVGGALALILGALAVGAALTVGGVELVHYSESTEFCTLCHTMKPQEKAHAASPHSEVSCGECHVTPGVLGFVKAKLEGTRELTNLVLNTYPRPIPPIEHAKMPDSNVTCVGCHAKESLGGDVGPNQLILRTTFADDEKNTRKDLAVVLRPARAATLGALGVHWHIDTPVEFSTSDTHGQSVDTVVYTDPKTGKERRFIAVGKLRDSSNADADIDRLRATGDVAEVSCITCHNRIGHDVRTAEQAVDDAMALGRLDPSLPYLKKTAVDLLKRSYATAEEGEAAIAGLPGYYLSEYPIIAQDKATAITQSTEALAKLFEDVSTPDMKTGPGTYPSNIGHQAGTGCFRCHDGAHYEVVDQVVTRTPIKSTCDTCHTFPQLTGPEPPKDAQKISAVMEPVPVGQRPADHNVGIFAFDHALVAPTRDGAGTTCGACHRPTYCETCHDSGAIRVEHDQMLYNHAESIRLATGPKACAVCHQPQYCTQCHKGDDLLGPSNSRLDGPGA